MDLLAEKYCRDILLGSAKKGDADASPDGQNGETVLVQILPIDELKPSPENDDVYQAIAWNSPDIQDLARSIKEHGIQEPLLISRDGYIISGHRRWVAAHVAQLTKVPVRIHRISRADDQDAFIKLLVEMNTQRIKSTGTLLAESLVKVNPKSAHQQIVNERKEKNNYRGLRLTAINPDCDGQRALISDAKQPFLDAILGVLEAQRDYWPLSDRQIHYRLLGPDAPLTHASKPDSRYLNNKSSYRKLTDLLARGRVSGLIPWRAIEDETRPTDHYRAFQNVGEFFRRETKRFLFGYWRDRQQSQPNHVEILAEKLTVRSILQHVAFEYTIPLTITRGMSSLPPKKAIHDRYALSQKRKLILLVVSDLDPAGDAIAEDLVKSFRRDFKIVDIEAYKVALKIEQVEQFGLSPSMEAKEESPTYHRFVRKHGNTDAYELEAMRPSDLVKELMAAIDDVLDLDRYNEELGAEETDSAKIIAVREQAQTFFGSLQL